MGREIHDTTAMHSSIALLQERFRQLQRVKEMREERQLLKMLSAESKHFNSNNNNNNNPTAMTSYYYYHDEPTRVFFHPEFTTIPATRTPLNPPHPHPHVSLSLWPTSQSIMHQEKENNNSSSNNISIFGTQVSMNSFCPTADFHHSTCKQQPLKQVAASWKNVCDNWDSGSDHSGVDTTLHL